MPEREENLKSAANEALKDKAFDYLRRYAGDGETLRSNREEALKAYRRDPYKEDANTPTGSRSKFVMSDVADTIDGIMPSLAKIFYSGTEVVKIEGRGPEDEAGAELLNRKVNWDFTVQNNGFLIFFEWFKAAMLNKFSIVKYWWDSHDEYQTEKFDDLSDEAFQLLGQDKDFITDKHDETEVQPELSVNNISTSIRNEPIVIQKRIATHTVAGRRIINRVRRPVAEVVPPEEFICSLTMRDLKSEEFVAHRKRVHKFDLMRNYKLKESDLEDESQSFTNDSETYERFKDLGGVGFFQDEESKDFYYIVECHLKEEVGDQREQVILTLLGNRLIRKVSNQDGGAGFCLLSPNRMPHRAIGLSVYDQVGDIQKLDSMLARYILNNIYYQTEGMLVVNEWKINLADFQTQRRPGGVVRTKDSTVNPSDAIWPVPVQPLAGHVFGLLETVQSWKEQRTPVTRYNQGLDADSLNKTARGISEIMAASQQKLELIARIFAETGVRDLFIAFAQMNITFLDVEANIKLDQKWATVNPKTINVRFDVTIDVALGTGSREMKVQQTGAMLDRSMNPTLISSGVVQAQNVYELMKTIYLEMGYKNVDKYLTNPQTLQPQGGQGVPGAAMGPAQGNGGLPPAGVSEGLAMVGGSQAPAG